MGLTPSSGLIFSGKKQSFFTQQQPSNFKIDHVFTTTTIKDSKTSHQQHPSSSSTDDLIQQAKLLKKQALRTRLEAEHMNMKLTLQKLTSLEDKYEKLLHQHHNHDDDAIVKDEENKKIREIKDQLDFISRKIDLSP